MNPAVTIAIVACVFVIAVLAGVLLALRRSKAAAAAEDAALDAAERQQAAQGPELVGFGPQTSSLPQITPEMLQPGGSTQVPGGAAEDPEIFGQRSFGFFGAVTSAISIVPQVDRLPQSSRPNDEP